MDFYEKKQLRNTIIAIASGIIAFLIDIILVNILKDQSSMCRWLWLPLISLALAVGGGALFNAFNENSIVARLLGWPMIIWGVIRGFIVVGAYFHASSGFWAIVGAIFLCLFMLMFNSFSFLMVGVFIVSDDDISSVSSMSQTFSRQSFDKSANLRDVVQNRDETVKNNSVPRQGALTHYFHSSFCSPQNGMIYFWISNPSMSSMFGSHSNYTITGTLGIKQQAAETFHVTSTDMNHYLNSVVRDIEEDANEVIREYQRNYPDDETNFKIEIDITLNIVD